MFILKIKYKKIKTVTAIIDSLSKRLLFRYWKSQMYQSQFFLYSRNVSEAAKQLSQRWAVCGFLCYCRNTHFVSIVSCKVQAIKRFVDLNLLINSHEIWSFFSALEMCLKQRKSCRRDEQFVKFLCYCRN